MQKSIPEIGIKNSSMSHTSILTMPITSDMEERIKMLKAKHGSRAVNSWLRQLWQMGLDAIEGK